MFQTSSKLLTTSTLHVFQTQISASDSLFSSFTILNDSGQFSKCYFLPKKAYFFIPLENSETKNAKNFTNFDSLDFSNSLLSINACLMSSITDFIDSRQLVTRRSTPGFRMIFILLEFSETNDSKIPLFWTSQFLPFLLNPLRTTNLQSKISQRKKNKLS